MKIPIYVFNTVASELKDLGIESTNDKQTAILSVLDHTLLAYWVTEDDTIVIYFTFNSFESPYSKKLIDKLDEVLENNIRLN